MGPRSFSHCPYFLHCRPHRRFSPLLPHGCRPSKAVALSPRAQPAISPTHPFRSAILPLPLWFERSHPPIAAGFVHSCPPMPVIVLLSITRVFSHLWVSVRLCPPQSSPLCHHRLRQQWSCLPAPQRWIPSTPSSLHTVVLSRCHLMMAPRMSTCTAA